MYDPDSYDAYSDFQRRDAQELFPYLVSQMDWRKGRRVLDFGCGSGFITKHVLLPLVEKNSRKSPILYGIDLSKEMIDFASIKYEAPNLTYMVMDLLKDDSEFPCQFDKIFSSHVLHWIPDQEKALRHLFRILHRHGEIGLYFIANAPVFSVYETMGQNPRWAPYLADVNCFIPKTHFSEDPARDLRHLMTTVGFHPQESTVLTRSFTFESLETMIEGAMAANPFIRRIPVQLQAEYKEDFQRTFVPFVKRCEETRMPDGVEVDYQILLVRGRKM